MKRIHGYLVLLPIVLASSSCGNNLDWGSIEAYKEATELTSTYVESGNRLEINIDHDGYLNNVDKDKVIVQSRESLSSLDLGDNKELNADSLKKSAISSFNLEVGEDIKITIENYAITTYVVIFNKAATKDGKFAFASVDLKEEVHEDQPYLKAVDSDYFLADINPEFHIESSGLSIADSSKIIFSESLEGLSVDKCKVEEGKIIVSSKGTIDDYGRGLLTFKSGFFEEIDYDVGLIYEVDIPSYWIDSTSFNLENDEFSFLIHLFAIDPVLAFNGNLTIGSYTSSKMDMLDGEGAILSVTIPFKGTLEEALTTFSGQRITFSSKELTTLFPKMVFLVNEPTYEADCKLLGQSLSIEFYYRNAVADPIPFEAVSLVSPQLGLEEGDKLSKDNCVYEQTLDGFVLTIATEERLDYVSGSICVSGDGRFKTLWGSPLDSVSVAFDCMPVEDGVKGEFDEAFCEKVINATAGVDEYAKVLNFGLLVVQFGIGMGSHNPFGAITSLIGLMNFFGFNGHSGDPTIQDVLNKLEDIANQIKIIDRKIDALNRQMQDARIASEIGFAKVLFNQYHGEWESFYNANIRGAEDLIRDYTADMRSYLIKLVWDTEDVTYNLKFYEKDGKTYVGIENSNRTGYTLEGYEITSNKSITLNKSYFKDVADKASRYQGYYKDFDIDFRKCLNDNLKASYSSLGEEELKTLNEQVYAHIMGQAQFASVSESRAQAMTNYFLNFANGIIDSKLDNLFRMLECLYNFQGEAKNEIKQFRTKMKLLVDKYAGIATTMAQFCPGIAKQDITSVYENAVKKIRETTYLQNIADNEVYCYSTHSKIDAKLVKANFNTYFKSPKSNDCEFGYNFAFEDLNTGKTLDTAKLGALVSETELNIIYARTLNAIRTSGGSATAIDFYKYLKQNNIITDAVVANKVKYEGKEVIVSYEGINSLSNTNFLTECVGEGSGDYFATGREYKYGEIHGAKWWSGREATGAIYNLDSRTIVDNAIERYARYDQTHWYWSTDEHWSYESKYGNEVGRVALMFLKG